MSTSQFLLPCQLMYTATVFPISVFSVFHILKQIFTDLLYWSYSLAKATVTVKRQLDSEDSVVVVKITRS